MSRGAAARQRGNVRACSAATGLNGGDSSGDITRHEYPVIVGARQSVQ